MCVSAYLCLRVLVNGVLVLSPHSFAIGDTSQLHPFQHGGFFVLVKTPKTYKFVSLVIYMLTILIKTTKASQNNFSFHMSPGVLQETMEKQLCEPQVLTPDFSKPEVRFSSDHLRFGFIHFIIAAEPHGVYHTRSRSIGLQSILCSIAVHHILHPHNVEYV